VVNGNRIGLLLGAAIVAAAAMFAVWHHPLTSAQYTTDAVAAPAGLPRYAAPQPAELPQTAAAQGDGQGERGAAPIAGSASLTLRQRFRESTDYASFIQSILSEARAGDMDAQYYVHAALNFCDTEFRALFKRRRGPGWLTHDEALNRTARYYGQSFSWTEAVEQRCRTLMEGMRSELGDSRKWLEDAANNGQPVAMAALAKSQLIDISVGRRDKKAWAHARDLLASALVSKDPEVMWAIGEMQYALNDSEDSTKVQWAWWLAACERGYECGPQAILLEFTCRYEQCPPGETVVQYMRRLLQTDFPAVEELAREINANIDAEAWSDIDIDG
jgi:hypothetical protein